MNDASLSLPDRAPADDPTRNAPVASAVPPPSVPAPDPAAEGAAAPRAESRAAVIEAGTPDLPGAPEIAPRAPELAPGTPDLPTEVQGFGALDDLPDGGEKFWAAFKRRTIETDMWDYSGRIAREMTESLLAELPPDAQARVRAARDDPGGYLASNRDRAAIERAQLFREVRAIRDLGPRGNPALADAPLGEDEFQQRLLERRRAEWDEVNRILDVDGEGFAGFMGGLTRDILDPINLALMPFGAGGGIARTLAVETVLSGVAAGAGLPREFEVARELDLPEPRVGQRILVEGLAGGVIGTLPTALVRGVQAFRARQRIARLGKPEEVPEHIHEEAQAEAAARLRDELPDRSRVTSDRPAPAPTGVPELGLPPGAPPDWPQIRNGIFAGESNGDFDALFSFQNRPGGRFANVRLTEMTVEEAIEFSRPDGEYARWVKGQIGRVATPMGAFQVVGTTLRAAAKALRLSGDEVMTPELQDRIGLWIFQTQGTKAWVGYRGPQRAQPRPVGASAPFVPTTTRAGFTSAGQVRTAAGTRIDVEYQVVDARDLIRASGDLQPRDRSLGNSDEQISNMAATLDPVLLMPAPTADRGAPIVGPDNVIESGNGRFGAIVRAAELHPDRADAYRQQIEAAGFDIPPGVETPVLIGRRMSELDDAGRRNFVIEAQDSGVARMTPVERGRAEAATLDPATLSRLDPARALDDPANGDFVRAALDRLPRTERNAFVTPDKRLNADGRAALERALFARAFDDADLLRRFTEGEAGELRALMDALFEASPSWARLVADVSDGAVRPEFNITGHVIEAMRLIGQARLLAAAENLPAGNILAELLDEPDLIEGAVSPLTRALVGKFWVNGRAAPKDKVAAFLTRYANEARRVGRTDPELLDGVDVIDALRAVDAETFADLTEIGPSRFAQQRGAPPVPRVDEVFPENAYAEGALSPEAEAADEIAMAEMRAAVAASSVPADGRLADLAELVERGASPAEIEAHPVVQDALAEMQSRAETPTAGQDGYRSDEWHASRQYVFDGENVTGTEEALKRWSKDAKSFAGTDGPATDRVATIILGPPAAGKSSIAEALARETRAAILDSDEIKKTLPEFDGGLGAARVHEESSDLANMLERELVSGGVNVIVPKVGGDPGSIRAAMGRFKAAGYSVRIVNMAVSTDEAYRRMIARFIATGRIIPPEFVRATGEKPSATFRVLKKEGQADGYAEIDNNPPRGAPRDIREIAGENPFGGSGGTLREGGEQAVSPVPGRRGPDQEGTFPEGLTPAAPQADIRAQLADAAADAEGFRAGARAQGDELLADGDFEMPLENGQTISARALLDDIDDDMALDTVIATCTARTANG